MRDDFVPNFFIIGAARSGTSSLYEYLRQHPEVYFCTPKEPMYFAFPEQQVKFRGPGDNREINRKAVTDFADYSRLFADAKDGQVCGEASANYLYSECAARNIALRAPNAKLIAVLRNPVERAFSSYLYMVRDGRETADCFSNALDQERSRVDRDWEHIWHYTSMGFYYNQLLRYHKYFPADQIKIVLHEDLAKDTKRIVAELFEFIGVDTSFQPATGLAYNQSGVPRNRTLNKIFTSSFPVKERVRKHAPRILIDAYVRLKHMNLKKPYLDKLTRSMLNDLYCEDIENIEKLLKRDLSSWKC